jgi:hypothetical protein
VLLAADGLGTNEIARRTGVGLTPTRHAIWFRNSITSSDEVGRLIDLHGHLLQQRNVRVNYLPTYMTCWVCHVCPCLVPEKKRRTKI